MVPGPYGQLQGPRAVAIVDELPVNATGKVMKEALRQMAGAGGAQAPG